MKKGNGGAETYTRNGRKLFIGTAMVPLWMRYLDVKGSRGGRKKFEREGSGQQK